jgi:hypothetical protein
VYDLGHIRRLARARLDDLRAPYLWEDWELTDYINITLWDACIRAALVVEDGVEIPFTQDIYGNWNATYALNPGVLDVQSVGLASRPTFRLTRTSMRRKEQRSHYRPASQSGPYEYALDLTMQGTGGHASEFVRTITFIGKPYQTDIAYIDVTRLPKKLEEEYDVPEVDPMWVPDLIYGITGLAYMKRDSDTFDPRRSEKDMAEFTARYGERLPAVVLRERQVEVPYEMQLG